MFSGSVHSREALEILSQGMVIEEAKDLRQVADQFAREAHRTVFLILCGMLRLGRFVTDEDSEENFAAVCHYLRFVGEMDKVGGPTYLVELWDTVPCGEVASYWAQRVRDYADAERVRQIHLESGYEAPPETVEDQINRDVERLLSIGKARSKGALVNFWDLCSEGIERYCDEEDYRQEHPYGIRGAFAGLSCIDGITGGHAPGTLTILSAATGMGKTAYGTQAALRNAWHGKRVLYFSLEMLADELWQRLLSQQMGIPLQDIRLRRLTDEQKDLMSDFPAKKFPIIICDKPRMTPREMHTQCRKATEDGPLSLVVVDYLQITAPELVGVNREREVADVADKIKALAMDLRCAVLALSQVNEREEVRESRAIAHVADMEILLRAPSPAITSPDGLLHQVEFVVRKHRQGPRARFKAWWSGRNVRFHDLDEKHGTDG